MSGRYEGRTLGPIPLGPIPLDYEYVPQGHYVTRNTAGPFGAHQASCTCGWTHAGGVGSTAARGTTHAVRSHIRSANAAKRKARAKGEQG